METIDYPECLYHYTSLDKLALILKSQKIRLNSLDKMDDTQEQRGRDVGDIGKFVFVSSWTADSDESIPMWKMYTDPGCGVRIRLRSNPFSRCPTLKRDITGCMESVIHIEYGEDGSADTFLDHAELIKRKIYSPQAWAGEILCPVVYTDDDSLLEPPITTYTGNSLRINLDPIGRYKNRGWEFQHEWRYIMHFYSVPFSPNVQKTNAELFQMALRMSNGSEPAPIDYFDLPIEPTCFSNMEITASPQLSSGNKILLDALIEKYNPCAKLVESKYKGLL